MIIQDPVVEFFMNLPIARRVNLFDREHVLKEFGEEADPSIIRKRILTAARTRCAIS